MNNDDSPFASRRESPGLPASPIDQAIDRAVRKMMQVDPPAGLRRRVMARIEAGPSTRGFMGSVRTGPSTRGFMSSPGFAVAAALAIVVLGVVATRNRVAPAPVDAPAATVAVPEKTPEATSRVEAPPQPVAAPPVRPRVTPRTPGGFRREPIPMAPVADIFGTRTAAIAAAADPIADAVWTAPTAPDVEDTIAEPAPLVVRPVGVPPIETPPIVIAPLDMITPLVGGRPPTAPR